MSPYYYGGYYGYGGRGFRGRGQLNWRKHCILKMRVFLGRGRGGRGRGRFRQRGMCCKRRNESVENR